MNKFLKAIFGTFLLLGVLCYANAETVAKRSVPAVSTNVIAQGKIIDYCMVVNSDNAFVATIQKLISEGWQPYGSPFYMTSRNSMGTLITYYVQAMVKYE